MSTTTVHPAVDNGVAIDAILEARAAMAEAPAAAQFQWRARCEWVRGTHSRTVVSGYFGAGEEQARGRTFFYDADHPELFAADDNGATPVEFALVALASCLTAGLASVATNRGIQLHSVTAELEGDQDLQGGMGLDPDVRNGYSAVRVRFDVDADATHDEIVALVAQSQKRSAVFDLFTNPTNVVVDVA